MSLGKRTGQQKDPWYTIFCGGIASACACVFTQPIDLVKVRQQLQGEAGVHGHIKASSIKTAIHIVKNEGPLGLYCGLSASLGRQLTYSTVRYGAYPYVKEGLVRIGFNENGVLLKFGAGCISGAIGCYVGNPNDVVLVRMQADKRLPPEQRRNYKGILNGLIRIIKEEGITTLWKGSSPNIYRAMLMTAGQIGSYDQIKGMLLDTNLFHDGPALHFTASAGAGFIATVITSPLDVVKTRIMNMKCEGGERMYKGVGDCFAKTYKSEGIMAFYKGFGPNFTRLVPQTILTFIFYEQIYALMTGKK